MFDGPVFVVGSGRSGTTLLYHMLLSAGGFVIYRTEVQIFETLAPAYGGFRSRRMREAFLRDWFASEHFQRSGLPAEEIGPRFLEECRSAGDFQRMLLSSMARMQGAIRWADCTPMNLLLMPEIRRSFPDARFLHIHRDGRDVALSLSRLRWIQPMPWDRDDWTIPAAVHWEWVLEKGRRLGKKMGKAYMEVRYEDLVTEPRSTLRTIQDFIDHDLDYDRIQSVALGSVSRPNTAFDPGKDGAGPIGRWKSGYDRAALGRVEAMIAKGLEAFDYPVSTAEATQRRSWSQAASRRLYRISFSTRKFLKMRTPLGRWSSPNLPPAEPDADLEDKTLRPGRHLDFIREIVRG